MGKGVIYTCIGVGLSTLLVSTNWGNAKAFTSWNGQQGSAPRLFYCLISPFGAGEVGMIIMSTTLSLEKLTTFDLSKVEDKSVTYIGIDFGTSTTVVSYVCYDEQSQKWICKPMKLKQTMRDGALFVSDKVPTVIAYYNNKLLVGEGAFLLKHKLKRNESIWYAFKMELGEDLGNKYYESELGVKTQIPILNAKDATTVFFRFLKDRINKYIQENNLNPQVKYVISVPASFEANQRQDLIDALSTNQIDVSKQSLIDEPNAAFLNCIYDEMTENIVIPDDINPKVLVFDFGAGTCDISILEVGVNHKGVYSKNLAISKFEKLGGDDIDRYIAAEILYPFILKRNDLKEEDFIISERKKIITSLLGYAENLKIQICKAVSLMRTGFDLSDIRDEDYVVSVKDIRIDTSKGELSVDKLELTSKQFTEVMEVFISKRGRTKKYDQEYGTIYTSVTSSLKKANLGLSEIDYVVFIGGSSLNPYIQDAIRKWLPNSKLLLPSDPQIHVSKGAAIHSFVLNALGVNIIQPITSEPICVVTQQGNLKVLVPAGTGIPTNVIKVDNLVVGRNHQNQVEIPICISNRDKLLKNIIIRTDNPLGFSLNTDIEMELELTADKLLAVRVRIEDEDCFVDSINPFANKELTTQEREALKIEKSVYNEASKNNGVASKKHLLDLAKAYENAKWYLQAAEVYELCNEKYPNTVNMNAIGCCYSCAGISKKALWCAEEFYRQNPKNDVATFNLAYRYKYVDTDKYLYYLNKTLEISPKKPHALFELGRYEKNAGKIEEGMSKIQDAYSLWKEQYEAKVLNKVDYTWLPSAAEEVGDYELANRVREEAQMLNLGYDLNNAPTIKQQ